MRLVSEFPKVERGVPIPDKKSPMTWQGFLQKLKPSESFIATPAQYAGVYMAARRAGIGITTREIPGTAKKRRVWVLGKKSAAA